MSSSLIILTCFFFFFYQIMYHFGFVLCAYENNILLPELKIILKSEVHCALIRTNRVMLLTEGFKCNIVI